MHLGEREPALDDPRQQAGLFYVPGLATAPVPDAHLAWLEEAAVSLALLGDEIDSCLAASPSEAGATRLAMYLRGNVQYEARRHARRLLTLLDSLPLARIPNLAPDIDIVALDAGSGLAHHRGRMNSRCVAIVHLDGGAVDAIVGGERHTLSAGAHLMLDPSFGVEYRNASASGARLALLDVWHPDLAADERQALSAFIVAAVDFDTRLEELA